MSLELVPLSQSFPYISLYRNNDMSTAIAGDKWSIALTSSQDAGRCLCIGCNTAAGFVDNLLKIAASGSLQVGGVNVLTTPHVSCRVTLDLSNNLTVSNNRGRYSPTVSRPPNTIANPT